MLGKPPRFSPEIERQIRADWEGGELSAEAIGRKYGATKSTIIGIAHRRKWDARRLDLSRPPRTIFDRLAALHAKMDRVLKECVGVGRLTESAGD